MRKVILVVVVGVFVLFVVAAAIVGFKLRGYFHRPDGSVVDRDAVESIDQNNYYEYLESPDGRKLEEVLYEEMKSYDEGYSEEEMRLIEENSIRRCGGLAGVYYQLRVKDSGEIVKNDAELIDFLDGINSPEQAIAYLYATHYGCSMMPEYNGQRQFVKIGEGDSYIVRTIYKPVFGCGRHQTASLLIFVDGGGKVGVLDQAALDFGSGTVVCVD